MVLDRLSRLHSLAVALSAAASPAKVAEAVFRHGLSAVRSSGAALSYLSEPGRLKVLHETGVHANTLWSHGSFGVDEPLPAAEAFRSGEPVWLPSPASILARYPTLEPFRMQQGKAWAALPLSAGGRPIGTLGLTFAAPQVFEEADRLFLTTVAELCAHALERASRGEERPESEREAYVGALKESEARYRRIVETSAEGICITDTEGEVIFVNTALTRMSGYAAEELVGKTVGQLMDPEWQAGIASRVERRRLGFPEHYEAKARKKDGSAIWLQVSAAPIQDEQGQATGSLAMVTDISDRKQAEEPARRLQRALRTLGQCNEAVLRASEEPELLRAVCAAVVEAGGYRLSWVGLVEEGGQRRVRPVAIAGEDAAEAQARITAFERDGGPTGEAIRSGQVAIGRNLAGDTELAPWRAEARERGWGSEIALPLIVDGRAIGALMVHASEPDAFDGDEVKLLTQLAGNLAFGIAARRLAAERKKMEATLLVSERMSSLGTLAAGVAHEINNPLSFLISNLELAQRELSRMAARNTLEAAEAPRLARYLDRARDGAERVRVIVRDLKTFSRADEERIEICDLRRVVEAAIGLVWNEIRHRARLVTDFGEVPAVRANDSRLGQVFLNLLTNAAQAIAEGASEQNEIKVATFTTAGGRAAIEVRDTGHGIAPENLRRIFDPFFTSKPVGVGTGLGLSVCHGIVSSLGGEISVQSEPGKGAAFLVTLPAAKLEAEAAKEKPASDRESPRGRILVIDDEAAIGEAMIDVLAEHEVRAFTQPQAALELLGRGERFDIIFCDLMMPQMTGIELFGRLKQLAPDQVERVVFMTGGAFTQRAREFLSQISNPRLDKPIDLQHLLAVIAERLRWTRA